MSEFLSLYPSPRAGVASRLVDGIAVAVTPEDTTLHTFENAVATAIWRLVDGHRTVGQIVEQIVERFEVGQPEAERDVVDFVKRLDEKGLVQLGVEVESSL